MGLVPNAQSFGITSRSVFGPHVVSEEKTVICKHLCIQAIAYHRTQILTNGQSCCGATLLYEVVQHVTTSRDNGSRRAAISEEVTSTSLLDADWDNSRPDCSFGSSSEFHRRDRCVSWRQNPNNRIGPLQTVKATVSIPFKRTDAISIHTKGEHIGRPSFRILPHNNQAINLWYTVCAMQGIRRIQSKCWSGEFAMTSCAMKCTAGLFVLPRFHLGTRCVAYCVKLDFAGDPQLSHDRSRGPCATCI